MEMRGSEFRKMNFGVTWHEHHSAQAEKATSEQEGSCEFKAGFSLTSPSTFTTV
jgi:hypothetical protein